MSPKPSPQSPADERAVRIAALQAAREAIDRELNLLVGSGGTEAGNGLLPITADEPNWVLLGEASGLLLLSPETAAKRIAEHGLGVFERGRWRVDTVRVRAYLAGRQYERLDPYPRRRPNDSVRFGTSRNALDMGLRDIDDTEGDTNAAKDR